MSSLRASHTSSATSLYRQRREDEYTYVLEGEIGVHVGGRSTAHGNLVFKHRNIPYTFWNDGDAPARALEIISPAGSAWYF